MYLREVGLIKGCDEALHVSKVWICVPRLSLSLIWIKWTAAHKACFFFFFFCLHCVRSSCSLQVEMWLWLLIRIAADSTLSMRSMIFSILNSTTKISTKQNIQTTGSKHSLVSAFLCTEHPLTFIFTKTQLFITFTMKTRRGKRSSSFSSVFCSFSSPSSRSVLSWLWRAVSLSAGRQSRLRSSRSTTIQASTHVAHNSALHLSLGEMLRSRDVDMFRQHWLFSDDLLRSIAANQILNRFRYLKGLTLNISCTCVVYTV